VSQAGSIRRAVLAIGSQLPYPSGRGWHRSQHFAVIAGVGVMLVANVWLDALPGPFVTEAAIGALTS